MHHHPSPSQAVASRPWIAIALTLLSTLAGTAIHGDGAITFTDVVTGGGSGIDFRRTESASEAIRDNLLLGQATFTPADIPFFPMRSRGVPGVAVFDYDRDSDLDLYVTNGPGSANSLYSNQLVESGTVTFVDVAAVAGVDATDQDSSGVCYGDVDNDGDHDLMVLSNYGPNRLFQNEGATFLDISASSGVGADAASSISCAMGDVNGDGLLDVVVGNAFEMTSFTPILVPSPGDFFGFNEPNQLLVNQGGNVFADLSDASGIRDVAVSPEAPPGAATITWAVALVDIDLDGDLDFFHADDQGSPPGAAQGGQNRGVVQVFENDSTGSFTNVTAERGTAVTAGWMGLAYGDFDRDGRLDFFVTNFGNHSRALTRGGNPGPEEQDSRWFLQRADGTFADSAAGGSRNTPFGWGVSAADYDNDGDTDVVYHGGLDTALFVLASPGVILAGDGAGDFRRDSAALAGSIDHRRRTVAGVAVGDLDDSGFVDVVSVSSFDAPPPFLLLPAPPLGGEFDADAVFIPTFFPIGGGLFVWSGFKPPDGTLSVELSSGGNGNGSVQVELLGTIGLTSGGRVNRDGIGAVVRFAPEGGHSVLRPVLGGSSHASQDSLRATFGLGRADAGTVEVLWPGGVRNRLDGVESGERVLFPEIPCSFDGDGHDEDAFEDCVEDALEELVERGILDEDAAEDFEDSMEDAFEELHGGDGDDDDDDDD